MKYITLAVLALVSASIASAVEPSKLAVIRQVLSVMDSQATLEKMRVENVAQTRALMVTNAGPQASDPVMKRVIEKAGQKYDVYSREFMGWKRWEAEYVAVYDEAFTESELKDLIAFYNTPAGKAMIRATPLIAARMQKRMFEQSKESQAKIESIIRQSINEVRAEEAMK